MKILFPILLIFSSLSAHAVQNYTCTSAEGNVAELTIKSNSKSIYWNETWHAASSKGTYIGIEEAPYSTFKGYHRYQLQDFLSTVDSGFFIAVSNIRKDNIQAVVYFDNDDHYEEEVVYNCTNKNLK
ncbi:MAG: hypothetical protein ACXVCA_18315 [Bdellovibrio sp.]